MDTKTKRIRESLQSGGKFEMTTYANGKHCADGVTLDYLIRESSAGRISDHVSVMFGANEYCTVEQLLRESTILENEKAQASAKAKP